MIQIVLERRKRSRFLEACPPKEFEMPANFESTWLVGPGRPIRLDKVAIHQNAAFRQNFVAARVHVRDRLLPAKSCRAQVETIAPGCRDNECGQA